MADYQQGTIYKIVSENTDKVYVGSTTQTLEVRFSQHKNCYEKFQNGKYYYITSYELLKQTDCKIELLENFPCNSRKELCTRERFYIETLDSCNKIIPGRIQKEWRELNKDKTKIRNKLYKDTHKEKLEERGKFRVPCDICGKIGRKDKITRHKKTNYCKNYS